MQDKTNDIINIHKSFFKPQNYDNLNESQNSDNSHLSSSISLTINSKDSGINVKFFLYNFR